MIGLQRYPFEHEPYAVDAEDDRLQGGRRGATAWSGSCPSWRSRSPTRAARRSRARRSRRRSRTCTAATRTTCQLCGECDVGCNFGAKNTLDYNYLTHAKHHGAEIRTLADVRRIEPREGGGYGVGYADLGERRRRTPATLRSSPATTWSSAPARSGRPTCCCATAARSRGSRASSARASAATATC